MQSHPREASSRVKKEDNDFGDSTEAFPRVKRERNDLTNSNCPDDERSPQTPIDVSSSEEEEDDLNAAEDDDDDDQSHENASNQLVVYDPTVSGGGGGEIEPVPDPIRYTTPSFSTYLSPNPPPRVLPSVGAFTVQCANCFKWRLIPTKEKYEEIREHILDQPFVCEVASEWRPEISCDDPADISQDGSRLWAIDKPNIAQPPPGWQRLLRIRGEGSTKFADVYYAAPTGKKLRSMVEVQKYLVEHPEYLKEGVNMSQFSFQIPKPLQENYVRKRPPPAAARVTDGSIPGMSRPLEPAHVNPLSWVGPDEQVDLQLGRPAKKQARRAPVYNPKLEEDTHQPPNASYHHL